MKILSMFFKPMIFGKLFLLFTLLLGNLFLGGEVMGQAKEGFEAKVQPLRGKHRGDVHVEFENTLDEPVTIEVVDDQHRLVFVDTVKHAEKWHHDYNLSMLPHGDYHFLLFENNQKNIDEKVHIKGKPHYRTDDDIEFLVDFSDLDEEGNVEIVIQNKLESDVKLNVYNASGEMVLSEGLGNKTSDIETISFGCLKHSLYLIEVGNEDFVFHKQVEF